MKIVPHCNLRRTRAFILTSVFCLLTSSSPLCAAKWQVSYFYDKDKSSLVINDLQFPTRARGVAAGYLDEKGASKPVTSSRSSWRPNVRSIRPSDTRSSGVTRLSASPDLPILAVLPIRWM